jgi:DNA-binding PadR family transcriptional regulator
MLTKPHQDIIKLDNKTNRVHRITNGVNYELVAFVRDGKIRERVFVALYSQPKYAYEITKELNAHAPSVCRALNALKRKGLVQCLNPNSKRRKYYKLTPKALKL